jgi:hypothetical protein
MLSSYRLGDLILLNLNEDEIEEMMSDFPTSFGSKYVLEKRKNPSENNVDIITRIVLEHIDAIEQTAPLPSDISDIIMIHLRLGDVMAGTTRHELQKRPLSINHLKQLVQSDETKKYVMGKCFFAKPSSTNYEECIVHSNLYLQSVLRELNAEHFDSGNADIDLCCAVKAKLFIQGRGYFSKLIVEIRKKMNLPNIETEVLSIVDY